MNDKAKADCVRALRRAADAIDDGDNLEALGHLGYVVQEVALSAGVEAKAPAAAEDKALAAVANLLVRVAKLETAADERDGNYDEVMDALEDDEPAPAAIASPGCVNEWHTVAMFYRKTPACPDCGVTAASEVMVRTTAHDTMVDGEPT